MVASRMSPVCCHRSYGFPAGGDSAGQGWSVHTCHRGCGSHVEVCQGSCQYPVWTLMAPDGCGVQIGAVFACLFPGAEPWTPVDDEELDDARHHYARTAPRCQ